MKRKILFCIVIMLLTGIVLAQASSIAEGMVSVAGNYDARVKLRETPRGKVISIIPVRTIQPMKKKMAGCM